MGEGLSEEEYCKKSLPRVPPGCNREGCCKTFSAKCRACNRGMSKEVFCKKKPKAQVAREISMTARRTHLHQVANGSNAAENLLPSASLAPRTRARKRSAEL